MLTLFDTPTQDLRIVLADATDDEMAALGWVRSSSYTGRLRRALRDLLGLVVDEAMSGKWDGDPEAQPEVHQARACLADPGLEEQIGWIRYNDDAGRYEDFRYTAPTDRARQDRIIRAGYVPAYARRLTP